MYRTDVNIKTARKRTHGFSFRMPFPNFKHLKVFKSGVVASFSNWRMPSISPNRILVIFKHGAYIKMVRIAARRVVAVVANKHSRWDYSSNTNNCKSVSASDLSGSYNKLTITPAIKRSFPRPAFIWFSNFNMTPKTLLWSSFRPSQCNHQFHSFLASKAKVFWDYIFGFSHERNYA